MNLINELLNKELYMITIALTKGNDEMNSKLSTCLIHASEKKDLNFFNGFIDKLYVGLIKDEKITFENKVYIKLRLEEIRKEYIKLFDKKGN